MTWGAIATLLIAAVILAQGIYGAAAHVGDVIRDCTNQLVIFLRAVEEERQMEAIKAGVEEEMERMKVETGAGTETEARGATEAARQ